MTPAARRSLLGDPMFGRLWFIQASTQVGGNMSLYALTILVFASTRSNAAVSALVMSFLVPQVLLSAIAGVLVDRLDVRRALIVPNAIRTLLTLGLALAGANVPVLLALNLGISLTTVILTPAEGSMIPRIVPKPQLETAMGIFNLTLQGSFAVGFAFLGPLLVSVAGPSFVLAFVVVFYAAATGATFLLPPAPAIPIERANERGGTAGVMRRALHEPLDQLREGFAAIRRNREVARPLIHLAGAASLVGVIGVLGPDLAASLGVDPNHLIVVVLPLGLGVVAGVVGLNRFGREVSRRRAAEAGLVTFGVLATAMAGVASTGASHDLPLVPLVAGLALIAGAAYATTTVSAQTALFENMEAGVRGRVFGVLASIVSASSLLPILVAGPLADATSGPLVIGLAAIGVLAVAAWSAFTFGPRKSRGRSS
ncbi:MAG TPA: MFS transporter [Candidatus Limnocylindrales bacterium]|nr:MFS transporter [Candidatus Limnocylindrales bacterium]